jgi:hypothetical protein
MSIMKETPNARINPPPDDTTQLASQDTRLMKGKLRAVGLNELLGAAYFTITTFI